MAKAPTEIRSLARSHTETAINVLAGIMMEKRANSAARVAAANSLLDRGWGKAAQPIGGSDELPAIVFAHVLRTIIDKADTATVVEGTSELVPELPAPVDIPD